VAVRILIQTTIPYTKDDWSIERFSLLRSFLATVRTEDGENVVVTARDRAQSGGDDPVLSQLDASDFDELWLFAVDSGDGLGTGDCRGISAFARRGGGLLVSRDHQDLGCSIFALDRIGAAQYFHTHNPGPSPAFRCRDDVETPAIDWPNYHSGRNGDFQRITPTEPIHPLLRNPARPSGVVELFPAHPHEGAVGAPADDLCARVIATGTSRTTGTTFNLAVAFEAQSGERGQGCGRAIADSSFHHYADYNWDPSQGAPSFVDEPVGDGMLTEPRARHDIHAFVRNAALWLAGRA
jgi:hypothetical protein